MTRTIKMSQIKSKMKQAQHQAESQTRQAQRDTERKAKDYFIMANQYLEASKLLLTTMINSGNSNSGFGQTALEAENNMKKNSLNSDSTLFIPALFSCYQSTELFIKGMLLLNNTAFKNTHEVSSMLLTLKNIYGEQNEIYNVFNNFYNCQIAIIKDFTKTNNITTTKELYESLRYPENIKYSENKVKSYSYFDLKYNGDYGIEMFNKLIQKIDKVKEITLNEFNKIK